MHASRGCGSLAAVRVMAPLAILAGFAVTASGALAAPLGFQGENGKRPDIDNRQGQRAPSSTQRALARDRGATATWNRFGTPRSLTRTRGYIATGLPTDPVATARRWIAENRGLLGLSAAAADDLEVVSDAPIGAGRAILLRQRFDGLPAGRDGMLAVGVRNGRVAYASSSLARTTALSGERRLSAEEAVRAAAARAGIELGALSRGRPEAGWTVFDASSLTHPARARLVAVPTPTDGARRAWETELIDNTASPAAYASFIDAETGDVLVRESLVDHLVDNPTWKVFRNAPPLNYSSLDTRDVWCWLGGAPDCGLVLQSSASPVPWDVNARTNVPTETTIGNAARSVQNWDTNDPRMVGTVPAAPRLTRDYQYTWTNQWFEERCNPETTFTSTQRNDIDAALANLFAMHNRMHDWAYHLGFTEQAFNLQDFNFGRGGAENDPEQGNAQAGGRSGGPPNFEARDNANQITPADGIPPITNMYLWQPIAGAFYAPCVDGDFDMTVIGHEYTHAISNRMVGGPSGDLTGNQADAMGESWSDLTAVEYLHENGFTPVAGENPFAVGPYVTGDQQAGIRNYGMNASPLNYSDVGYDFVCNVSSCPVLTQVHADGEIWSATNYDIRQAMIARYGAGDPAVQLACARGEHALSACPGNRRWAQLVFDAWLLMSSGAVSMVDARNALLAADLLRFNGANQDLLWNAFARRGFGETASSIGTNDADPVPSFESPFANNTTARLNPIGQALGRPVQLFAGRYEARVTPVADTNPATPLGDSFLIAPGSYEFLARGDGLGAVRFTATIQAGGTQNLSVRMFRNLASAANGAAARGDGINIPKLIDDTEATNWASLGSPVAGKQVTVRLDPSRAAHTIRRVQVSALLRTTLPTDQGGDTGGQSRYSALRQFEILACEARGTFDCSEDAHFTSIFTSAPDVFPAVGPRPRAPDLTLRSFDVPETRASHVRLRVLTNQCTGGPAYQGDQDDDPRNVTDCDEGSTQGNNVRAAELQVFAR
jgi:extracellular elastinolytic metalloproteinase